MDDLQRLQGDLNFVRNALNTSTRTKSPAILYFLWAVIIVIGFGLVDFRPDFVPMYWVVAGPAGFLASAYLGWRHSRHIGQASATDGKRHLLHWGAVLAVIALGVALGVADALPARSVGTMVLLLLALGYFTAGLHLDRFFLWVGALLAAGSVVVMVGSPFAWSGVGIVLAVSLVVAGIREGRSREAIA